jgi:plasmid stabilization system protein ParE
MAFRVKTTAAAKRDLDAILGWLIEQNAGEAGLRWFRGLKEAIASLTNLPARCSLAPESASVPFEIRQLLYGSTRHRLPDIVHDRGQHSLYSSRPASASAASFLTLI